jgi:hypothetical protein
MKTAFYGVHLAAVMVAAAMVAEASRTRVAHRNPKYFNPADKPGPFDLVVTHAGAPNVAAVVTHFAEQGTTVVTLEDDATAEQVAEQLAPFFAPDAPALSPPANNPPPADDPPALEELSFADLKAVAKEIGVPITGKRTDIEAAIVAKLAEFTKSPE